MGCNKETDQSDLLATSKNKLNPAKAQSNQDHAGDPVNLVTGAFSFSETDCSFPTQRLQLEITRHYDSGQHNKNQKVGPFGWGWTHSLNLFIEYDSMSQECIYIDDQGAEVIFRPDCEFPDRFLSPPGSLGLTLLRTSKGNFQLRQIDGLLAEFNEQGRLMVLTRPGPAEDSQIVLDYDDKQRLSRAVGAGERFITFSYQGDSPLIHKISDHSGREWQYMYDRYRNLIQVRDAGGRLRKYSYIYQEVQATNDLGEIENRKIRGLYQVFKYTYEKDDQIPEVTNYYTTDYRVHQQTDSQGGVTRFDYNRFTRTTHVTDAAGWTTVYCHDCAGNTVKVRLPEGSTTEYVYDSYRNLLAEIDPFGNRTEYATLKDPCQLDTQFEFGRRALGNRSDYLNFDEEDIIEGYDSRGNRALLRDPLGNTYRYLDYTEFGDPQRVILPTGDEILTEYDTRSGLPLRMQQRLTSGRSQPLLWTRTWQYDAIGNLVRHRERTELEDGTIETQQVTEWCYDRYGHHPIEQVSWQGSEPKLPKEERFDWDERGQLVRHEVLRRDTISPEPLLLLTNFGYDILGRQIWEINSQKTAFCTVYDVEDRIIKTYIVQNTDPQLLASLPESSHTVRHQWQYDKVGNEIAYVDPSGAITKRAWDERGLCIRQEEPTGFVTEYEYDRDSRQVSSQTNMGYQVSTTYDLAGRIVVQQDNVGLILEWDYDTLGNIIAEKQFTNEEESVRRYKYDAFGRPIEIQDTDGVAQHFSYDERSNVIRLEKAFYVETYQYDGMNRPLVVSAGTQSHIQPYFRYEYDDALNLVKTYDALKNITQEIFDTEGNLVQKVDAEGRELNMTYDTLGYVLTRQARDKSVDANFQYDALGRLITADEGNTKYAWQYDQNGRIVQHHQYLDDNIHTVTYQYDPAGRLIEKRLNDQWWMQFDYKPSSNFISTIKIPQRAIHFDCDSQGRVIRENWDDGSSTFYGYRVDGLIEVLEVYDKHQQLQFGQSLIYDAHGRPTNETRKFAEEKTDYCYYYDELDRLNRVDQSAGSSQTEFRRYEYDVMGNRLREYRDGVSYHAHRYDTANRLLEVRGANGQTTTYEYDRCGNLTRRGEQQFVYDVSQRMHEVRNTKDGTVVARYEYAATGQRTRRHHGQNREIFIYDALQEIEEVSDIGHIVFFWRGNVNSALAITMPDRIGAQKVVLDRSETMLGFEGNRHLVDFDPFGIVSDVDVILPVGFHSKRYDSFACLYYNHARWYDPSIGRFTQADPFGIIDGPNVYLYAKSNPVSYFDPFGYKSGLNKHLKSVRSAQGSIAELLKPGHLVEKHVGRKIIDLHQRLENEPNISEASSFFNLTVAENTVREAIKHNEKAIVHWLSNSSSNRHLVEHQVSKSVGVVVRRQMPRLHMGSNVQIVLKRNNSKFGFHILTGFIKS